ncbi:hypothetical protein DY000_02039663 [Brassica cretica]|uniref:Uncharacterized protein n=1 Tax=Brassica cretica TaxID=69181 RepID=A0ABQ7B7S4_BRACR|nr:hypothetical protein DY000_02039663 [Brassica cretica]
MPEPSYREDRRDGSVHVARHLSPLHLKAGADQRSEADGPRGQVASQDESAPFFPEPWSLVRLPPRPRSLNGGLRRTEDRDYFEGKDQGFIAITEQTSGSSHRGTGGRRNGRRAIDRRGPDPTSQGRL